MQVQLIVANKSQKGKIIPVNVPAFQIGRAKDCHLRSTSSKTSRHHCVIHTDENTVTVRDFGGENGTYVNGARISSQTELQDGDEITVGRHTFVMSIKVGETQPVTSENDFFEILSDSSLATPSPTGNVVNTSHDVIENSDTVAHINEPIQVVWNGTSSSGLRRHQETPARRKSLSAEDHPTGQRIKIVGSALAILCLLVFGGVWLMGEPTNPYGAVPIVGTLTLDGKPVAGANVILHPRDGGRVAGGITDKQGNFTVITCTSPMANGAIPGEYDVTFSKIEMPVTAPTDMRSLPAPGTPQPRNNPQPSRKYVIPQKYGDPKTSGLSPISVKPTGKNSFDFALSLAP